MNGLEKHLNYFPPRIRRALLAFDHWEKIREIRLRCDLPLSLTGYNGNLFLSETGKVSYMAKALFCTAEEIRILVSAFCKGAVYRYFDTLKDGFVVDEDGWRLGLCPREGELSHLLPERFEGINLRLPRNVPGAARAFLQHFENKEPVSTLILSPPGDGKTTLLRALASSLSRGEWGEPLRVAVIDEREELFPSSFIKEAGLCDVLSGYRKERGIEIATRIFSPQVIVCDEIGRAEDVEAILHHGNAGTLFFASAHARSPDPDFLRPGLKKLIEAGIFQKLVFLERIPGERFRSELHWRDLK